MEKKIASLKAAYAAKDAVKLRAAARSLVAYYNKHPMGCCFIPGSTEVVSLARRICAAPSLPL